MLDSEYESALNLSNVDAHGYWFCNTRLRIRSRSSCECQIPGCWNWLGLVLTLAELEVVEFGRWDGSIESQDVCDYLDIGLGLPARAE